MTALMLPLLRIGHDREMMMMLNMMMVLMDEVLRNMMMVMKTVYNETGCNDKYEKKVMKRSVSMMGRRRR